MKAGALVFCLLDAEGEYTPEGYELVDTSRVGEYELRLWRGKGHVQGTPVKFIEVSLNAQGRSFDPESQKQKFTGSTHALGRRGELLSVVARWISRYGELYVGSYIPAKLATYHKLFKRYLPQLKITDLFAPFDECEGKPEYFLVTAGHGVIESILEDESDAEVSRQLHRLPSVEDQALVRCMKVVENLRKRGLINEWNKCEVAESAVTEVVYKHNYITGNEVVDINFFNNVLTKLLQHASSK